MAWLPLLAQDSVSQGVHFEDLTLKEACAKAKAEGKKVFPVDNKRDKWSDRCVIDGLISITSITHLSHVKFKWIAPNLSYSH